MRAVVQRVTNASVTIATDKREVGEGLVILLGIGHNDTEKDAQWLAEKIINLRVFPDKNDKFDKSILDIKGEFLVISQFTVYGDSRKGRRPDFSSAATPEKAIPLYEKFIAYLKESKLTIQTGEFAANMLVEINNNGPVTLIIDS